MIRISSIFEVVCFLGVSATTTDQGTYGLLQW
jgi:hypothetical protein